MELAATTSARLVHRPPLLYFRPLPFAPLLAPELVLLALVPGLLLQRFYSLLPLLPLSPGPGPWTAALAFFSIAVDHLRVAAERSGWSLVWAESPVQEMVSPMAFSVSE